MCTLRHGFLTAVNLQAISVFDAILGRIVQLANHYAVAVSAAPLCINTDFTLEFLDAIDD